MKLPETVMVTEMKTAVIILWLPYTLCTAANLYHVWAG